MTAYMERRVTQAAARAIGPRPGVEPKLDRPSTGGPPDGRRTEIPRLRPASTPARQRGSKAVGAPLEPDDRLLRQLH